MGWVEVGGWGWVGVGGVGSVVDIYVPKDVPHAFPCLKVAQTPVPGLGAPHLHLRNLGSTYLDPKKNKKQRS